MAKRKRVKGTASLMPVGIGGGVLFGLFLLGVISFVSAWLVYEGHLSMKALGYLLMAGRLTASLLGSLLAIKRVQRRKAIVGILTGGILFLSLAGINGVFFGGHYEGMLTTGVLLLLGSVIAIIIGGREGHNGYKRKSKNAGLCKIANR